MTKEQYIEKLPQSLHEVGETTCINTIRTLCIDAVQKANSGHPGTAMGMAPVVYCLWQRYLRFDPAEPAAWWPAQTHAVTMDCLRRH